MHWSGHRTEAMLRRYHIIDLEDLRRAGKRASDYQGPRENVVPLAESRTLPAHTLGKSTSAAERSASVVELSER